MKEGFKAIASLILAFIMLIPFTILGRYIGGGVIASFLFAVPYYLLAWKLNILKNRDSFIVWLGIIPLFNVMGVYALSIIFIHDRILNGDIRVFTNEHRKK